MLLHIDVVNKIATYQRRDGHIVCGNSGYQIEFNFDSEWNGVDKTAIFIWNGQSATAEIKDGVCDAPVISNAVSVMVGVYSESAGMATTGAEIPCKKSIRCTRATPIGGGTV